MDQEKREARRPSSWFRGRSIVDGVRYRLRPGNAFFAKRGSTIVRTAPKALQHRQQRRLGLLGLPLPRAGCFAPERPRKESRAKRLHRHLRWVESVTADWS